MSRSRWIILALFAALAIASIYVSSNPEMAARYGAAVRSVNLSPENKDLVMGGLAIVIAGYFAWFFLIRKE